MDFDIAECRGVKCGYLFIKYTRDATLCNECGNNTYHPRICKVGATTTDLATLRGLVQYLCRWPALLGPDNILGKTVAEVINDGLDEMKQHD